MVQFFAQILGQGFFDLLDMFFLHMIGDLYGDSGFIKEDDG